MNTKFPWNDFRHRYTGRGQLSSGEPIHAEAIIDLLHNDLGLEINLKIVDQKGIPLSNEKLIFYPSSDKKLSCHLYSSFNQSYEILEIAEDEKASIALASKQIQTHYKFSSSHYRELLINKDHAHQGFSMRLIRI